MGQTRKPERLPTPISAIHELDLDTRRWNSPTSVHEGKKQENEKSTC